jgi:hypothetical protein
MTVGEDTAQTDARAHPTTDLPNFQLMNVSQLKDKSRKQNLSGSGRKEILIQCLTSHQNLTVTTTQREQIHNPINGFAMTAKWTDELQCSNEKIRTDNMPILLGPQFQPGNMKLPSTTSTRLLTSLPSLHCILLLKLMQMANLLKIGKGSLFLKKNKRTRMHKYGLAESQKTYL